MIEPKYYTLNTLFADRVFRIPHYQRFYSWQKKQRADLFADLEDLWSKDKEGDRHHFMATIVCFRTKEKKTVKATDYQVIEIVDGQQRITTLVMMLKALQERVKDKEVKREIGKILVKDDDNLLLLQTNNINQHLFNRYLRDGTQPKSDEIKTHADGNLAAALAEISRFIDKWEDSGGSIMELIRILRNRIGFVVYDTEESHAVYTVFECLNSRGLAVDWLDKTKSMLMGVAFEKSKSNEVGSAKIDELNNLWGNIYNSMARHPVSGQEILRVTATIYVGGVSGKPLSAEDSVDALREYCNSADKTITVTNWIQLVTDKLVKLHNSKYWAPVTRILQARILAVALMLTESLKEDQRKIALDQWERVSFRIYGLYGKDSRTKVGDFVRLARNVMQRDEGAKNHKQIMQSLVELGAEYPIEDAVNEITREPRYDGFEEECRYILWRYEEMLARSEGAEINSELRERIWAARSASETIEHIFPQTHRTVPEWNKLAKSEKNISKIMYSLGNVLLLPPGLNSKASNKPFKEKKGVYKSAQGLRIVARVLKNRVWNSGKIKAREKEIVKFLSVEFDDLRV